MFTPPVRPRAVSYDANPLCGVCLHHGVDQCVCKLGTIIRREDTPICKVGMYDFPLGRYDSSFEIGVPLDYRLRWITNSVVYARVGITAVAGDGSYLDICWAEGGLSEAPVIGSLPWGCQRKDVHELLVPYLIESALTNGCELCGAPKDGRSLDLTSPPQRRDIAVIGASMAQRSNHPEDKRHCGACRVENLKQKNFDI